MDNSDDKTQAPYAAHGAPGQASAALSSRRRLLRGGLIGAPALLALKSSPVLACNCKKPSGFSVSGNLSRTGSKLCADPAKKPDAWKSQLTSFKDSKGNTKYKYTGTSILTTTTFGSIFSPRSEAEGKLTFADLLGQAGANSDVRALMIAVYLESIVMNGQAGFPTTLMAVNMWNHGIATSVGYKPVDSHSLRWYSSEVTAYLKYLTATT